MFKYDFLEKYKNLSFSSCVYVVRQYLLFLHSISGRASEDRAMNKYPTNGALWTISWRNIPYHLIGLSKMRTIEYRLKNTFKQARVRIWFDCM